MSDKKFDLSRRKVLGSLGVIGAGSAVAGAGTMAYFNDEENMKSNTVQAGTLDLELSYSYTANMDIAGEKGGSGGAGTGFNLSDVKPGDSGNLTVTVTPVSNPAWIWLNGGLVTNSDGTDTEPENATDSSDGGELAQNINATLSYEGGPELASGPTLADVLSQINGGRLLDSDTSNNSDDYFAADHSQKMVLDWSIDESVGNIIQGDKVKFDLMFYAEQARHNGDPSNPWN